MKYIKSIPAMALVSFVYWLAFSQNMNFFVWVSWIFLGLSFMGILLKQSRKIFEEYNFFRFLIGLPFGIINYYIFWNFDESKNYLIAYIIINLITYSVLFNYKSTKNES